MNLELGAVSVCLAVKDIKASKEAELRGNLAGALFMAGRRDQALTQAERARAQGLKRHWVLDSLHLR